MALRRLSSPLLALGLALGAAPASAERPTDKQQCVAAYEDAQRLRKDAKLTTARERLLVCAQEVCPVIVRRDCTTWLGEVEAAIPTVVFEAVGPDRRDLVDVRLTVDGRLVAEQMDGKAIALDPGAHSARFEAAGLPPVDERFVAREGEKSRRVVGRFGGDVALRSEGPAAPVAAPVPVAAWIAAGVGVAGLGVFTGLALAGESEKSALDEAGCKSACDSNAVDSVKTKFLVADIGLAVGVAGLATATVLYLTRGTVSPTPAAREGVRFVIGPTVGGAMAGAGGRF